MKNETNLGALAISAALCCATAGNAQSIDGLYQPSGASWSCSADQIGVDGVALTGSSRAIDQLRQHCN
ncbi:hypothetical protein BC777_0100 [Yoonia maricola]|uniref:Uncharacterized protein n=1 Tax=Yoonia maricola TaxID=420999 RepID=A0A2M8WK56_9RHOB|nr:hypothetical protein [Yoonia maricola]PJI91276.1 hypothetical protein BC777_0100 [Yoonia maricola]